MLVFDYIGFQKLKPKVSRRKPKTLNQIRCRKCKMPKKAAYGSSIRLKVFEIDYYSQDGVLVETSLTPESKENFEIVRKDTFCQCVKNVPSKLSIEMKELQREVLGDNPSKNKRRQWKRYGKV